jgi:hypothetical protein
MEESRQERPFKRFCREVLAPMERRLAELHEEIEDAVYDANASDPEYGGPGIVCDDSRVGLRARECVGWLAWR